MDWQSLRRMITTNDQKGRSTILIDGEPASTLAVEEAGLAEIWTAGLTTNDLLHQDDLLSDLPVALEPDPNKVKIRWFTVPTEDTSLNPEEREAQAAFGFAAAQATHARVDTTRHPMMHKTDTLDVIILIRGQIDLLLDDGQARQLKPGDVVIQQATNHAWVNRGAETALLVAVLMNTTET